VRNGAIQLIKAAGPRASVAIVRAAYVLNVRDLASGMQLAWLPMEDETAVLADYTLAQVTLLRVKIVHQQRTYVQFWVIVSTTIFANSSIRRRRRGRGMPSRWSNTFWASSGSVTHRSRIVPL
jgi:hypothetical protein